MELADIRGDKLELHAQYIVGKMGVACSNRDGISRFSKGVEYRLRTEKLRRV